jgi:hypothetical protein
LANLKAKRIPRHLVGPGLVLLEIRFSPDPAGLCNVGASFGYRFKATASIQQNGAEWLHLFIHAL